MSDFFEKVSSQVDPFKKLMSYIPGFSGYVERQNRRDADKLLRETVARRFEEHWSRASNLQADMVAQGQFTLVDDMEKTALALRTFIDKISKAARGYSGMFDAVKINEKELEAIYSGDHVAKIKMEKKEKYPLKGDPTRRLLDDLIKKAGKWMEVSDLNPWMLARIIGKGAWPSSLIKKVREFAAVEENRSITISQLKDRE